MGDSRAYSFSNLAFEKMPHRRNLYDIYNFSGPQAVPAYSLFWLEKFIAAGIVPDHIFLVLSPEGFDDNKGLMHKPFLRLGADEDFIEKYKDQIPLNDLDEYYLDKIFALRKVEIDLKLFISRYSNKEMSEYNPAFNKEMMILNLYNGEQLAYANAVNDEKKLQSDSIRMGNIYFYNFMMHDTQFFFVEKIWEICQKNKIKID